MHFYTSVNLNYLAKARVLATSIKKHNPDAFFSLLLYDEIPLELKNQSEPFDEIVTVYDLDLPVSNLELWMYIHNTVELGTAIKGQALLNFLKRSKKVAYIDPDIVVYDSLKELEDLLDQYSCVLTPHQLKPDTDVVAIEGNEMGSMLRGTYNFGFYAANNSESGVNFATWFRDRLLTHCFDEVEKGLFTDQRWGNLVPAMFDNVHIWRNPGCNVSTWNITNREVTKNDEGKYFVNGIPLLFYHFSGFDSGAQLEVLKLFGKGNPALMQLRSWYIKEQAAAGQEKCVAIASKFNYYSDGTIIKNEERRMLKNSQYLQDIFKDVNPFDKADGTPSYFDWYTANFSDPSFAAGPHEAIQLELAGLKKQLAQMENSRLWKMTKPLRWLMAKARGIN